MNYLTKDLSIIFGTAIALTIVAFIFNLDAILAVNLYTPGSSWAWLLRNVANWPGIAISLIFLAFLIVWPLRTRMPLLRRTAIVWLIALIIGGGLLAQVGAKELAERPRPRETQLLGGQVEYTPMIVRKAELKGKSFTSGHAAMAFVFATPFFALRRRKPKLAKTILAVGLSWGALVGAGRMVLGAHFLTDVIWAAVFVLSTAAVAAQFFDEKRDLSNRFTLSFLLFVAVMVVMFSKFSLNLGGELPMPKAELNLNCQTIALQKGEQAYATLQLKGYGGPASNLELQSNTAGQVSLKRNRGIYRSVTCERATITMPSGFQLVLPENANLDLTKLPFVATELIGDKQVLYR